MLYVLWQLDNFYNSVSIHFIAQFFVLLAFTKVLGYFRNTILTGCLFYNVK